MATVATDGFSTYAVSLDSPYGSGVDVTPHDTNDLATVTRGIYVGGAGNLHVQLSDGSELTFNSLPVGVHRLRVRRVYSTSTTATNIIALY